MKKYIKTLLVLSLAISFTSCKDWLDVTPPSQIREEAQFNSVEGFQQALTGCYIGLTDDMLYGRALSWSTLEVMAGQFEPLQNSSSNDYSMQVYNYTSSIGTKYVDGIWSKAYNVIANANNALKYIDINKDKLDNINYSIIKGELLAIRAFVHFDLMRLYGYGNLGSRSDIATKKAIPYVTTLSKDMTPQLSYSQTIALMVKDLEDAIELLEIDPVTQSQPASYYTEVNLDGFFNNRQLHFNYYATSLLLARVYMWEGSSASITNAEVLANNVIADAEAKDLASFATSTSVSEDPIMRSEHMASLNTQNLNARSADYFKSQFLDTDIKVLYISNGRFISMYEGETVGNTDYRFTKQYIVNSKSGYTPLKYYGASTENVTKNYIPLIRIPEAYYIAAECYLKKSTPQVDAAQLMINYVRQRRGITADLTGLTAESAMEELIKEYKKEFICEGVMFFLYKRLGFETIPGYNDTADDDVYVLPYPASEIMMGREQ
ncbi:MAG: RagB/SusD family nutrient uptake outer membrane protein [Bacteroidales bacterium]|nr:RagB/SusD family nutrient uptake outer membrane protein [Bacteroidales bacterium]MDD3990115.1 RagB/SusD family nutrient uptake outer membrane protein [Bacteroidales bacterium]MDD4638350.1 RagB/SusD family nutrient uptake outer membrane protein [Bacteroidales bacterium]